ncbi:MAG: PD-(D/E)XK nuclease family protein [Nanoarchaeota archaeon]|nr:PD-(D/E)XK nuclease family protein [Nanoarchaeota archaeon]
MEKDELPPEIRKQGVANGYKLIDDKAILEIWRKNRKGVQYKDKTSGIILMGAVDNILSNGKKLVVLDYKTRGYPLKEDTAEHYQAQLDIYNFLLRENGYDTVDYAYLLFYHPEKVLDNGDVVFNTDLVKINTNAENGSKVFRKAIKILESNKAPESSRDCKFCKYLKEGGSS